VLVESLGGCWTRAQFGDFSECAAKPSTTDGGKVLLTMFAEYGQARVRPVFYAHSASAQKHQDALQSCPKGWRLPTKSEASRLWHAIERNPELPTPSGFEGVLASDRGAWYDDAGADCNGDEGSYIERNADGTFTTGCHQGGGVFGSSMRLPVMCVAKSGVFGSSVAKLPK
jgi:hypothetical protein